VTRLELRNPVTLLAQIRQIRLHRDSPTVAIPFERISSVTGASKSGGSGNVRIQTVNTDKDRPESGISMSCGSFETGPAALSNPLVC
jgi:hypothetical protein